MASEETGSSVAVDVPEELRSWLEQVADDRDLSVEGYVRELLIAQRTVETGAVGDAVVEPVAHEELDERLEDLESEFRDLLEDVRDRVVQVKRETDGKVSAASHEDLETALGAAESRLDGLATELEGLRTELDRLDGGLDRLDRDHDRLRTDLDEGFENFESVLEYLLETTDDLSDRADRLARATLEGRERVAELASSVHSRERADDLKRDAALEGIDAATCADCDRTVRVALLTAPECPYCAAGFVDVEPKRGFFGAPTLLTGDRPALAGGPETSVAEGVREDLEAERPDPGDVDWDTAGGED